MNRDSLRDKVMALAEGLRQFRDWDTETEQPQLLELELDSTWKVVVVREHGFNTIKIHERLMAGS
jgi:hypothetical protein